MRFSTVFLSAIAASFVSAQVNHTVIVGGDGLTFTPNQIDAAVGDTVNFEFHARNHTATQSTFASPCKAMDGGVDSGYYAVDAAATSFPVWALKINDLTPFWFYCKQGTHCVNGMVMAINVNKTSANTFDAFLANAKGSGSSAPGVSSSASSVASVASASTTSTPNDASMSVQTYSGLGVLFTFVGVALGMTL